MTEVTQDFGPRTKNVVITKPIVYGNVARYFGTVPNSDNHTHSWTIYVRSYENENMSSYIKKVHFKLHESYNAPNRILTAPPYEISETGWGEFEVVIKIYFADPNERPVTILHTLKLFKSGGPTPIIINYIVSEFYDELVFAEPSAQMLTLLQNASPLSPDLCIKFENDYEKKKFDTLEKLRDARRKVKNEIEDLRQRLEEAKTEITKTKQEVEVASKAIVEE